METFDEIINSEQPVLVDFYADWCGPCKAMAPVLKEFAAELKGKVRVLKINIDRNEKTANRYNIRSVPTFIIFKNGNPVWRHSGTLDKHTLKKQTLSLA